MIKVTLHHDALEMDGHAGAAPCGQDIVCAAASMLAYTLAARLEDMGRLIMREMEPGMVRIVWEDTQESMAAAAVVEAGFRLLSEAYPDNVQITGDPAKKL